MINSIILTLNVQKELIKLEDILKPENIVLSLFGLAVDPSVVWNLFLIPDLGQNGPDQEHGKILK